MNIEWNNFLREKEIEYSSIGYVKCPAFGNEKIYFTNTGFSHLVRKSRKQRDKNIQIRRLTFCLYAPGILGRSRTYNTHFKNIDGKGIEVSFKRPLIRTATSFSR
jgi:hypothetical protein